MGIVHVQHGRMMLRQRRSDRNNRDGDCKLGDAFPQRSARGFASPTYRIAIDYSPQRVGPPLLVVSAANIV